MRPAIEPQDRTATAGPPVPARRALAALSLSVLLSSLGAGIANVALPTLVQAFGASFQATQWVVLAYLLASTCFIVVAGRLGDLFGRRRLLVGGIALFTLSSILCGAAPTLALLVAARAAQGLGGAIMLSLAMALVGEAVPKERSGGAMGLLGTMSAVGTALGPALGGALIAVAGWRASFLVAVPLGVVALLLAHRCLPADRPAVQRPSIDAPGILLLAATLAAYALAMTAGRGLALPLLAAAGLGLALFVAVEARVSSPLIRPAMLRRPGLASGLVMSALVSTVVMATMVVGPFYLAGALGLDATAVGLVLAVGPVVTALTGVPGGRLTDRIGAPRATLAGLAVMATGALLLSLLPASLGIGGYAASVAVLTAGYALFQAANNTAVMAGIAAEQRGVVSGVLNLSRYLGLITGASAMGAVFALASAAAGGSPGAAGEGMRATFAVAAVLVLAALAVAARALGALRGGRPTAR